MDLIYEGITTLSDTHFLLYPMRQNGPDLRRDYDDLTFWATLFRLRSEWTWFTKGLRPCTLAYSLSSSPVRMDLIYEGITTITFIFSYPLNLSEWTWFTKGLRLLFFCWTVQQFASEWTWFTKGLRLSFESILSIESSQNGPDLRRDYDECTTLFCLFWYLLSEWTWFTKGLRLYCLDLF